MQNRNIIITGGNAGIGLATAKALAKMGANIYIIGRSKEKAEAAVAEIKNESGNTNVNYFLADLTSQASIRELAKNIKAKLDVVDVLINNAGGVCQKFTLSKDGIEMTIALNHFAYFLLTNLLLEQIKKSDYARIVNVSSDSHYRGKIDFDTFTKNKNHSVRFAYAQSKLANVLFTKDLSRRLAGTHVTANCLHPGFVKTEIGKKDTMWIVGKVWEMMTNISGISTEEGAKTSVYLASSPEVNGITGKYFNKCKEQKPTPLAEDENLQKKLWEESKKLCPIN